MTAAPPVAPPFDGEHGTLSAEMAEPHDLATTPGLRTGWRRYLPRSLAARLVTGVVALVVVLVLATGLSTYYALSRFLNDRLDQQVAQAATGSSLNDAFVGDPVASVVRSPQRVWALLISARNTGVTLTPLPGA